MIRLQAPTHFRRHIATIKTVLGLRARPVLICMPYRIVSLEEIASLVKTQSFIYDDILYIPAYCTKIVYVADGLLVLSHLL